MRQRRTKTKRAERSIYGKRLGTSDDPRHCPRARPRRRLRKVAEQEREIAMLRERLAKSDGSLFDLKKDNAQDIVAAIANNVLDNKAEAIAKGLLDHVKRKRKARQAPAG